MVNAPSLLHNVTILNRIAAIQETVKHQKIYDRPYIYINNATKLFYVSDMIIMNKLSYRSRLLNLYMRCMHSFFPLKKNRIVFCSFGGRSYSDNPKVISEELYNIYGDIFEYVWILNSSVDNNIPQYVKIVKPNSAKCFFYMSTSKVWISNFEMPKGVFKSKNQYYIQTWHGDCPFKVILKEAYPDLTLVESDIMDLLLVGSGFGEKVLKSAFSYNGKIFKEGCPRNDIFFKDTSVLQHELRKRYKIPNNAKVIMYAPTFRNKYENEQQPVEVDLERIKEILEEKTQLNWVVLLRSHVVNSKEGFNIMENSFIDVTNYPDMNELLTITDVLLSDYSSCVGDFALSGKLILLYQSDIMKYEKEDRRLYFKMKDSPFFAFSDLSSIYNFIENYNSIDSKTNCKQILDFYNSYERGDSSIKLSKVIYNIIY